MKRKIKMVRKQPEPVKDKFYFKYPFGGMTPHPPEDCKGTRFFKDGEGNRWTDNYFCYTKCRPNYCRANREYRDYLYSKMGKDK